MLKSGQKLTQKQSLQQKLSPQQIQFVKMLQLPTMALEQRVKQELEMNPVLEEATPDSDDIIEEIETEWDTIQSEKPEDEEGNPDPVDENSEIDWDSFAQNTEYDGENYSPSYNSQNEEWKDLPDPYHETLLEELEKQVSLLELDDDEKLIADQILGSLDGDGYFRRDPDAVVDNIAFNHGRLVDVDLVHKVRRQIQMLEPVGVASTDLRDCLLSQAKLLDEDTFIRRMAVRVLETEWEAFEKKHFEKLKNRLNVDDEVLKKVFELIRGLDPRPGAVDNQDEQNQQYIEPDFEVWFEPETEEKKGSGEFIIHLNHRNVPPLRISSDYKLIWENLKGESKNSEQNQAKKFIKEKVESAQWFIDSIRQRQNTLLATMKSIVAMQEEFFKYGEGLKPMILKDIAERVSMDISTISRVVNGKYVQTPFGVFELKYFFSEGLETESGEDVSSREVKKYLQEVIDGEDKSKPLSDQALTSMLRDKGYIVARRTVSKYRESLQIPVARLRKQIL
ncbi:MAG: RNA polymerase sigma-54 factor [Balneolaceae bacterium]|nr:MAG: RNA polymerase sigma-54 factor [Balneolaceae bacterium]